MSQTVADTAVRFNYRATWHRRLPTAIVAAVAIGLSAAVAYFSNYVLKENRYDDGSFWPLEDPRLYEDNTLTLEERIALRRLWYGNVYRLPPNVRWTGLRLMLGVAVLCSIMAGVVLLQALLTDNKVHSRFGHIFWPSWTGVTVVLSLIAFIYSFVETYTSTTMDVRGFFAAGLRPRPESVFEERLETPFDSTGTYNVEAYSCQVREILVTGRRWGLKPCVKAMTARWLTLPLFIVAAMLCMMSIWYPPTPSRKAATSTNEMRMVDTAGRDTSRHDSEASRASVKTDTAA